MTIDEKKQELAALEALPVNERTKEHLDRAFSLASEIRKERRKMSKPLAVEAESTDKALIQLWLPLGQREAFRALCTKQGLSLSAKLRAMIATELGQ